MNYDLISISSEDDTISVGSDKNVIKIPKKIIRRAKKSFPIKRNNYKKYQNASWKWCDILKEIDLMKENNANKIFKTLQNIIFVEVRLLINIENG